MMSLCRTTVPSGSPRSFDSTRRGASPGLLLATLMILCLPFASGCGQKASQQMVEAETSYNAGRYEEAYQQALEAEKAARDAGGSGQNAQVASAAYLAGMSAYRLDRLDEAERQLGTAVEAGEGEAKGRALAQRGAVFLRQGRFMAAAVDYDQASDLLSGEDAAKARAQADSARRAASAGSGGGPFVHPDPSTGLSISASTTPGGPAAGGGRGAASGQSAGGAPPLPPLRTSWTLQVACFRDRAAAERQAKALTPTTKAQGLGAPKILPEENPSLGPVYCVVIGEFATREGADQAKQRLGRSEYFVRTMKGT